MQPISKLSDEYALAEP